MKNLNYNIVNKIIHKQFKGVDNSQEITYKYYRQLPFIHKTLTEKLIPELKKKFK